jgi:hypothetical protein
MNLPISAADYYDGFPPNEHVPGDVWTGFPTFGVLPFAKCSALVITPACDLANRKVDTLTYVPIVRVSHFLTSTHLVGDVTRATEGQLQVAGLSLTLRKSGQIRPSVADLEAARTLLHDTFANKKAGQKESNARKRAESGLLLLKSALTGLPLPDSVSHFRTLMGETECGNVCKKIVTNAYRMDIHFLPSDGQPEAWSAISGHSVALSRYPLTMPLPLLDLTTSTREEDWHSSLKPFATQFPCISSLVGQRPMKCLRIRPRFVSDLLTRFLALYGRIGSPDFSDGTVSTYVNQIVGEEP